MKSWWNYIRGKIYGVETGGHVLHVSTTTIVNDIDPESLVWVELHPLPDLEWPDMPHEAGEAIYCECCGAHLGWEEDA